MRQAGPQSLLPVQAVTDVTGTDRAIFM